MRFLPAIMLLLLAGSAAAQVLVFDTYETVSTVQKDKIRIERELVLTNVARNPVIPGELHFKIYERDGDEQKGLRVENLAASNERGQPLSTKVTRRDESTDLAITIWDPMLPGFSYRFRTSYDLYFEPSGVLFYELRIPQEETTIPIKTIKQTVLLDDGYHVTYAPQTEVSKLSGNVVVSWTGDNEQQIIEYSSLPLPRIPFRAVNAFWGVVILALIGVFVLTLRRRRAPAEQAPSQEV